MSVKKTATRSREFSDSVIDTIREPLIALDHDLRVVFASRSFCEFFKVKPEETMGQLIYDLGNRQWDIPKLRELLEDILPQKTTFDNYEVEHEFATIGKRIMLLNARQIKRVLGKERIILLAIEDITERRLIEEKVLLAAIVEFSKDAIIGKSLDGTITSWNKGAEEIYGYTKSEIIGKSISVLVPPELPSEMSEILSKIKLGEGIKSYETVRQRKDGQNIYASLTVSAVYDAEGRIFGISSITRDITERKRAEEKLKKSKTLLESVFNSSQDLILVIDRDLRVLMSNWKSPIYAGHTEFPINSHCYEAFINRETPCEPCHALGVFNTGKPVLTEYYNQYTKLFKEVSTYPIFDDNNNVIMVAEHVRDITERKLADEALHESEKLYRSLFDNMLNAFQYSKMIFDQGTPADYIYLDVNRAFKLLTGLDDVIGRKVSEVLPGIQQSDKELFDILARVALTGYPEKFEIYVNALKKWFSASAYSPAKEFFVVIFEDINERKRAEEEIYKFNATLERRVITRTAQLEESNKELEAFTYSVSHDLRAPLRHIDGYVELLINRFHDALPEKGIRYLDTIADSARQMAALIEDLLQFSRTGRQEMRQAYIDMNLVLQEVLESIKQDNPGRNIEWIIATLPNVYGDYAMLRLVWINLLNNAAKFTRKKEKAKIEVGCNEDNGEYVFFVRDNGVGFDMQYAHKLFGVFQRLHSSEEFEGTGIGLANVRRIIAKHGGRTWAEAALDQGAAFYFTLLKNKEKKS